MNGVVNISLLDSFRIVCLGEHVQEAALAAKRVILEPLQLFCCKDDGAVLTDMLCATGAFSN